ncbi:GntR family transcriptional regulator [Microbacterium betulae]|uniref:GntR family transcriptional regulator n=1 Tax=Microbacterium betulae TaxID=2981139 RepID=A0AA97FGV6_9MICO|nr:GntR family transcriptional regulator [Microbacterium sp. AB]WOF23316.1 GntR family transcriptional regulator [Microbacterium sp. AB]
MTPSRRGRREGRLVGGPRSVTEIAADGLRRRIVTGALPQGAHISEQAIADELGVSRAALREALRLLERDGLVVTVPRAGSRVVSLTLRDAYEIVTLREHLEDFAIGLGVPSADPARLASLAEAVERMERNAECGDEEAAGTDGLDFHRAFIGLAGHAQLEAAFGVIVQPLGLLMGLNRRSTAGSETLHERAERHRRVLTRVEAGDAAGVRAELRSHTTTGFLEDGVLPRGDADDVVLAWARGRLSARR